MTTTGTTTETASAVPAPTGLARRCRSVAWWAAPAVLAAVACGAMTASLHINASRRAGVDTTDWGMEFLLIVPAVLAAVVLLVVLALVGSARFVTGPVRVGLAVVGALVAATFAAVPALEGVSALLHGTGPSAAVAVFVGLLGTAVGLSPAGLLARGLVRRSAR